MEQLDGLTFSGKPLDEQTLLNVLRTERQRAIGLDNDDDLNRHRELALEYYRGMVPDMPVAVDEDGKEVDSNRSKAVSTDLADCVETILPDLLEVFTGGEDALTFAPTNEDDVDAAEQETNYLRHVVFQRNDGFMNLYEWFKESLLCRTSVAKWWWEEDPEYEEYSGECTIFELQELQRQGIEITAQEPVEGDATGQLVAYEARKLTKPASGCWMPVASSDFGVAPETHRLKDTSYCVMRSRPQVQDLIADGYDADLVRDLPDDDSDEDEGVELSRNTSQEDDDETDAMGDLRRVTIHEHYLRADLEGTGKPQVWRITTGGSESKLLDIEKRPRIEYAALSPFPMMFRFYGQDMADKMMPWQRINSAQLRNGLDNVAFQLNARLGIAEDDCTEDTIDDVLNNDPGQPIRFKRQGAVAPVVSTPLAVDPFSTIEQIKTMGEQSSGVIRNAQGLNPDSLHETKGGMQIQNNAAQKRTRLMARMFAETGVKELFLGMHELLRSNATMQDQFRMDGKFIPVAPNEWERRHDMMVEVGVGSGGRDADIAAKQMLADRMASIIEAQGGISGPLVNEQNVYALFKSLGDRLGEKQVGLFISDPSSPEAMQAKQAQAAQPDPEVAAAQAKMQLEQQQMQVKNEMEQAKLQSQIERDRMKAEADAALARERAAMEMELARDKAAAEMQLAREKANLEATLARERMQYQAANDAQLPADRPGGSLAQ